MDYDFACESGNGTKCCRTQSCISLLISSIDYDFACESGDGIMCCLSQSYLSPDPTLRKTGRSAGRLRCQTGTFLLPVSASAAASTLRSTEVAGCWRLASLSRTRLTNTACLQAHNHLTYEALWLLCTLLQRQMKIFLHDLWLCVTPHCSNASEQKLIHLWQMIIELKWPLQCS